MEQHYRFEKKFTLNRHALGKYRGWQRQSILKKAYPARRINNIYFDSINQDSFLDNREGTWKRVKSRLRWYGEGTPPYYTLELKHKRSSLGFKQSRQVKAADISLVPLGKLAHCLRNQVESHFRMHLHCYAWPNIFNSYWREYYQTREGVRVTVDTQLKHAQLKFCRNLPRKLQPSSIAAVIEVKYSPAQSEFVLELLRDFPFCPTRSSKYVQALGYV